MPNGNCCTACAMYGIVGFVLVGVGVVVGNEIEGRNGALIGGGIGLIAWSIFLCKKYLSGDCSVTCNHGNSESESAKMLSGYQYEQVQYRSTAF